MIELIVEGKALEPALREMERSPDIRVIGPHISTRYPGAGIKGMRIAVKVRADSPAEASSRVRSYLPEGCTVRPSLA
jgi:hypothetical protein